MEGNLSKNIKVGSVARLTGGSIVLMAVVAMITFGVFQEKLFTQLESSALLPTIIGWVIICVLDFIVSWGVYVILKDKNRTVAIISGGLRLVYTLFLCVAISKLFILLSNVNKETMSMMNMAELIELTGLQFNFIWQLGLIIFGLHLIVTGVALFKMFPRMKILFVLLIIGGTGYCMTSGLVTLNLEETTVYNVVNSVMLLPMIIGELGLGIWLFVKGKATFNAA